MKLILLQLILFSLIQSCSFNNKKKQINFNNQIGIYSLDLERTDLKEYDTIREKLTQLKIEFFKDSTFKMNMKVPFMFDSTGKWEADDGEPYSYNEMRYREFGYSYDSPSVHFFQPYEDRGDTVFLIDATIPQKYNKSLEMVYFKKIK